MLEAETRRSWLAFCSGVRHATHVAEEFRRRGVSCATIFGKTPKDERDAIIAAFKRGEIRALASMGVLTTGFNAPAVDLIAMLRPTKSAGLYVQMAGRGTRLAEGKENCLVLDFAGNVRRHGPIDLVRPKRPGGPGDGPPPTKICPKCGTIVAIAALECPDCGFEFSGREVKLEPTASTLEVLSTGKPQWVGVTDVTFSRHEKRGGRLSLKVTYRCGLAFHTEWVAMGDHLGHGRACDGVLIDRVLEVARDELAAPRSHARHVEAGLRLFRDERGEIALIDQVADRHLVGDVGEERILALVQHAAVEPERRRGQTDHLERGVDRLQIVEEAAIHGVRPAGDQMGLVDQHQIGMADARRLVVDGLDAGEEDPGPRVAAAEPGRVDARRRLGPEVCRDASEMAISAPPRRAAAGTSAWPSGPCARARTPGGCPWARRCTCARGR